jgi:hypothetical protein
VDFIQSPFLSLNLRSESPTTTLITLVTSCLPVHSYLGFIIAGFTIKSLVFFGFFYNKAKVAWYKSSQKFCFVKNVSFIVI